MSFENWLSDQGLETSKLSAGGLKALRASYNAGKLEQLRESRGGPATIVQASGGGGSISVKHLSAGIMIRAGLEREAEHAYGAVVMEQARNARISAMSLPDMAAVALRVDGKDVPHGRDEMIRAALSGGAMTVALGDSATKSLQMAYRFAPATWRSFCDQADGKFQSPHWPKALVPWRPTTVAEGRQH